MDFLKKLFDGKALTFEEFSEAAKADKEIKLANLSDGTIISLFSRKSLMVFNCNFQHLAFRVPERSERNKGYCNTVTV